MDRSYLNTESKVTAKDKPTTSLKRKSVSNAKTTRPQRAAKRLRIISSEESDSDEEYTVKRKPVSSDESSDDGVKIIEESDSDSEEEIDSDDSEDEDSSDFSITSDDSDREYKKKKKESTRTGGKSVEHLSKVQQQIIKQYQDSGAAAKVNVPGSQPNLRDGIYENVCAMKDELLRQIEDLGERLPKNTLDDLINKLGGSEMVAEMTGRKVRLYFFTFKQSI